MDCPKPGQEFQLRSAVLGGGPSCVPNTLRPCPHSPCLGEKITTLGQVTEIKTAQPPARSEPSRVLWGTGYPPDPLRFLLSHCLILEAFPLTQPSELLHVCHLDMGFNFKRPGPT